MSHDDAGRLARQLLHDRARWLGTPSPQDPCSSLSPIGRLCTEEGGQGHLGPHTHVDGDGRVREVWHDRQPAWHGWLWALGLGGWLLWLSIYLRGTPR